MTAEQHVRMIVGDLVLKVAAQAAEIDALRDQLAAIPVPAPPPPAVPPGGSP